MDLPRENTMSNDNSGKPINDSRFLPHAKGIKAVILFPALTTPCLVKDDGVMDIVVALHESHGKRMGFNKEASRIRPEDARVFHSHLSLVPWGNAVCDRLQSDQHHLSHFKELRQNRYMIYQGHMEYERRY